MSERKQRRIKNFSGCWTEPDLSALAVWYITTSGNIDLRTGIGLAIRAVFGPLAVAVRGGTVEEVEKAIALSKATYEAYIFDARAYVGCTGTVTNTNSAPETAFIPPLDLEVNAHGHSSDFDDDSLPILMGDD